MKILVLANLIPKVFFYTDHSFSLFHSRLVMIIVKKIFSVNQVVVDFQFRSLLICTNHRKKVFPNAKIKVKDAAWLFSINVRRGVSQASLHVMSNGQKVFSEKELSFPMKKNLVCTKLNSF